MVRLTKEYTRGSSAGPVCAAWHAGVTVRVLPEVAALGFQGAAMLGAVWDAEEPVAAFLEAAEACDGLGRLDDRELRSDRKNPG